MSDENWKGYEGMKRIANAIYEGLIYIAIAIIIHGF